MPRQAKKRKAPASAPGGVHERQYLSPVPERGGGADRGGADGAAGVRKAQRFPGGSPPEDLRGKPGHEVVSGAGGIHRPDRKGGEAQGFLPVFQQAAFAAKLDDDLPDAGGKKNVRYGFRIRFSGKMARFILVGRDGIDQRKGIPDILQRQETEVRQLGIRENQLAGFLRAAEYGMNDGRVVEGGAEQRSEDQRPGVREPGRILFG